MGFKESIKNAYNAIIGRNNHKTDDDSELSSNSPQIGFVSSSELDDYTETTDEQSLFNTLGPELKDYIVKNAQKGLKDGPGAILPPRIIPVHFLTDTPTAAQVLALLGMVRWCMEKSSEGKSGENAEFTVTLKIKNRGNSPFIVEMGDKAIPPVPVTDNYIIGN